MSKSHACLSTSFWDDTALSLQGVLLVGGSSFVFLTQLTPTHEAQGTWKGFYTSVVGWQAAEETTSYSCIHHDEMAAGQKNKKTLP